MIYQTFLCVVLLLALVGCTPPAETASEQAETARVEAGRDIPLTEQVRTTSEKDLRLINALRSFLPLLMHTYGTPGMNIALARRGEIVWEAGFGYADLGRERKMTPETVFNSGSMGKVYTGMAIMKLVEEGIIDLTMPINDYLPFEVHNPLGGRAITVHDLMVHRPGLVADAALSLFRTPDSLRESVEAEFARDMTPMGGGDSMPRWFAKPGEQFMYSNLGIATLGLIVEENNPEGLSFSEYIQRSFMDPLGMRYSQYPPVQDQANIREDIWARRSTGYMPMGSVWIETPAVYFGEFPAGGFVSTPGDFLRFFLAFMNEGEYDGVRILAPETVKQALTPAAEGMRGMQMGMVWMLDKVGEPGFNFQHGGAHMFGWHNWGIAWPGAETAVVYATNQWPVPEITPDVTLVRNFIENWILSDAAFEVGKRRTGVDWSWKVSYVRGAFFTAALNYSIDIPTPVSDEQIEAAAASALVNPDVPATRDDWVAEAFVQGARDMRAHGSTHAEVSTFVDDNPNITREEFMQAYAELGGGANGQGLYSALFVPVKATETGE